MQVPQESIAVVRSRSTPAEHVLLKFNRAYSFLSYTASGRRNFPTRLSQLRYAFGQSKSFALSSDTRAETRSSTWVTVDALQMADTGDPLVAEREAHAATRAQLATANEEIKLLRAQLEERDRDPFIQITEQAVLKQTIVDQETEVARLRAELMQVRRRLAEASKQLDAMAGPGARQPLSRDFAVQLHQQFDRWRRLFEEQRARFAECDMFVARLKSSPFVRLTEYTLLERNLDTSHRQLSEELSRIGAVINGDQSQIFPAMRERLQNTFASLSKRHSVVVTRLNEIRGAKHDLQRNVERGNARLERAHKMITRTVIIAKEMERLLKYHQRWGAFTTIVEEAVASNHVVFITADGYVRGTLSDMISGLSGFGVGGSTEGQSTPVEDNAAPSSPGAAAPALELFPLPTAVPDVADVVAAAAEVREQKSMKQVQRELQAAIRAREDLGAAVASYMVQKNAFVENFGSSLARAAEMVAEEVGSFSVTDPRDTRIKELEYEAGFLRDVLKTTLNDTRALVDHVGASCGQLRALHERSMSRASSIVTEAMTSLAAISTDRGALVARVTDLERHLNDDHTRLTDEELHKMDEKKLAATYVAALERNLESARNSITFLGAALDQKSKISADADALAAQRALDPATSASQFDAVADAFKREAIVERLELPVDVFLSAQRANYAPPLSLTPLALQSPLHLDDGYQSRKPSNPATPTGATIPPSPSNASLASHVASLPSNPFSATGNRTAMPFTAVLDTEEPVLLAQQTLPPMAPVASGSRGSTVGVVQADDDADNNDDDDSNDSLQEAFSGGTTAQDAEEVAERQTLQKSSSYLSWFWG